MHTDNITIVRIGVPDVQQLTALSVSTFNETFAADNSPHDMDKYLAEEMNAEKLLAELLDTGNIFLFAIVNNQVAGYAKIRGTKHFTELNSNNPIEIERLYVLKEYQGRKAGAALMVYIIDLAINNQHRTIVLGVWEHNLKAISFYERWGFEAFGSQIFRLGYDEQTDILMKKDL